MIIQSITLHIKTQSSKTNKPLYKYKSIIFNSYECIFNDSYIFLLNKLLIIFNLNKALNKTRKNLFTYQVLTSYLILFLFLICSHIFNF